MRPGERLKEIRFRLGFTLRDVAVLSREIAKKEGNEVYYISNPWLTQLENTEAIPSIHKLFTLSCIYGVSFTDLLMFFGVDTRKAIDYHLQVPMQKTHRFEVEVPQIELSASLPAESDPPLDLNRTNLLSRMLQVWGDVPVELFRRLNFNGSQYGYIGLRDRTLDPLLRPGTFVQIDPQAKKILPSSAYVELDRPIYFVEFHDGYACSWCERNENELLLIPHPLSGCRIRRFVYPEEVEIVGRVTGVAMRIADPTNKHMGGSKMTTTP
jgi:transcriptional regulator with XRE-family HTH domain